MEWSNFDARPAFPSASDKAQRMRAVLDSAPKIRIHSTRQQCDTAHFTAPGRNVPPLPHKSHLSWPCRGPLIVDEVTAALKADEVIVAEHQTEGSQ